MRLRRAALCPSVVYDAKHNFNKYKNKFLLRNAQVPAKALVGVEPNPGPGIKFKRARDDGKRTSEKPERTVTRHSFVKKCIHGKINFRNFRIGRKRTVSKEITPNSYHR